MCFRQVTKGNNYRDVMLASLEDEDFYKMGSALKGKNLLLWEQILSFQS